MSNVPPPRDGRSAAIAPDPTVGLQDGIQPILKAERAKLWKK
jgi:hypothetical protein